MRVTKKHLQDHLSLVKRAYDEVVRERNQANSVARDLAKEITWLRQIMQEQLTVMKFAAQEGNFPRRGNA